MERGDVYDWDWALQNEEHDSVESSPTLVEPTNSSEVYHTMPAERSMFWEKETITSTTQEKRRAICQHDDHPATKKQRNSSFILGGDFKSCYPTLQTTGFVGNDPFHVLQGAKGGWPADPVTDQSLLSSSYTLHPQQGIPSGLQPESASSADLRHQENEYELATTDEEDMARLADHVVGGAKKSPPSSVIRGMDVGSSTSSIEVFDPNLQRSPPNSHPSGSDTAADKRGQFGAEDLLDYEVEWDEVFDALPLCAKDPSSPNSPNTAMAGGVPKPQTLPNISSQRRPFVRPRFPAPVRDKSPIGGLSNTTLFRTCFRIGEMMNEGSRCYKANQEVTFELYARVNYSSRESLTRVQHFHFMDLSTEYPPHPAGTLVGWNLDSLVDRQSSEFLGIRGGQNPKMCRCICRLNKEKKSRTGWVVVVLTIRHVSWEEIEQVKRIVCRT